MPRKKLAPKPAHDHLFRITFANGSDELVIARNVQVKAGGILCLWAHRDGIAYQRYLAPGAWLDIVEEEAADAEADEVPARGTPADDDAMRAAARDYGPPPGPSPDPGE